MKLLRDDDPTTCAAGAARLALATFSLILAHALALSGTSVARASEDSVAPEETVAALGQADDLVMADDGELAPDQAAAVAEAPTSEAAHEEELAQAVAERLLGACDPAQDEAVRVHQAFDELCRELRALFEDRDSTAVGDDLRTLAGDAMPSSLSHALRLASHGLGLEAVEVVGADGACWNMVRFDGQWAHVDVVLPRDVQDAAEPLMSDAQMAERAPERVPWACADGEAAPAAEGLGSTEAEAAEGEAASETQDTLDGAAVANEYAVPEPDEEPMLMAQSVIPRSGASLLTKAITLKPARTLSFGTKELYYSKKTVKVTIDDLEGRNVTCEVASPLSYFRSGKTVTITIPKGTAAGTYTFTATAKQNKTYRAAVASRSITVTENRTSNSMSLVTKIPNNGKVQAHKLRSSGKTTTLGTKQRVVATLSVTNPKGGITFVEGEKVGKLTFKPGARGTAQITLSSDAAEGTVHWIRIKVKDSGNAYYRPTEKTVKVTITVTKQSKGNLQVTASAGEEMGGSYEEVSSNIIFCGYAEDWSVVNRWVKHFDGYLYLPEGQTYNKLSQVLAGRRPLLSLGDGGKGGTYTIQSGLGDLVLDATGAEEGAGVQLAAPTGAASQQWDIERVETADGYATWSIKNVGTGLYLVGSGLGENNEGGADWDHWGQALRLSEYPTFDNQHNSQGEWRVLQVGDDSFEFLNRFDGLCVDAGDADAAAGSTVQGWGRYDGSEQRWILQSVEPRAVASISYEAARPLVLDEGIEVVRAEGSASAEGTYTLEDAAAFKQNGDALTVTYVDGGVATYTYDEQADAYVDSTDPKNVLPGSNVFVGERGSSGMTFDAQTRSLTVRWWNAEERKVYEDQRGLAFSIEPNYVTSIEVRPCEPVKLVGAKDYVLDESTGTLQLTEEGENRLHRYADVLRVHYEDEYGGYDEPYARTATGTLNFASKGDSVRLKGKIACTCDFEARCARYTYAGVSCTVPFEVELGTNSFKVNATTQRVLATDVKSDAKSVAALKVTGNKGSALTYAKASGSAQLSVNKTTGEVAVKKGTVPGTYTAKVKVTSAADQVYAASSKTVEVTVKVVGAQPMKVKAAAKTVKASAVKKAKKVVARPLTVTGAKGTLSYKKAGGSAQLSVNVKTGKVTVKKGTPKGTYEVKIKVAAAGTDIYKAGSKTVTTKVVVK